ncbi:hypothetical protein PFISCL1PPCAC_11039 [Pristionchus fissidentatus]|uniref:G protein-coupled receptor n=1 Tax=Pristionchus fissidentatus TaxID=1538716 RepID=A0AAV5VM01_9BILA|nr:hypothetical protein PFISCL1PPCAC_11039 [Pristionchus fissidentatus]
MVEIREESSTRNGEDEQPSTSASSSAGSSNAGYTTLTLSEFVKTRTLDCTMFATRLLTLFFAVWYFLPGPNEPDAYYYKALVAAAATNALRLQQRLGGVTLSREFLQRLIAEDSAHYLFYSVVFLTTGSVTMALLPITLYASLHAANFAVVALQNTGRANSTFCLKLQNLCATQTQNCLGIIACAEIFIIPLLISLIFIGKASLFVPFVYYRFLTMRYSSRRNPYTRQAFYQMRCSLQQISYSPSCPAIAANLINKAVTVISNLAPPTY